jgi:small subunit ribosomal protein S16
MKEAPPTRRHLGSLELRESKPMSVKIRLRRMGRKKAPHYRVVVANSQSPRDGRFVETLGYYKPLEQPARLVLDLTRVDYWVSQGAQPSPTVRSLVEKARKGGDNSVQVGEVDPSEARAQKAAVAETRRKAEAAAAEAKARAEAEAQAAAEAEAKARAEAEAAAAAAAAAEAEAAAAAEAATAEAADAAPEAPSDGEPAEG